MVATKAKRRLPPRNPAGQFRKRRKRAPRRMAITIADITRR